MGQCRRLVVLECVWAAVGPCLWRMAFGCGDEVRPDRGNRRPLLVDRTGRWSDSARVRRKPLSRVATLGCRSFLLAGPARKGLSQAFRGVSALGRQVTSPSSAFGTAASCRPRLPACSLQARACHAGRGFGAWGHPSGSMRSRGYRRRDIL